MPVFQVRELKRNQLSQCIRISCSVCIEDFTLNQHSYTRKRLILSVGDRQGCPYTASQNYLRLSNEAVTDFSIDCLSRGETGMLHVQHSHQKKVLSHSLFPIFHPSPLTWD